MAQQATREFWVSDSEEDAVRRAKITLKNLGDLTAVVPGQHVVGTVAFGVQHVTLKISWRPEEVETKMDRVVSGDSAMATQPSKMLGTVLMLEGTIQSGNSDVGIRSAFERFEEAYLHFDRSDYQPDRWGVLPITILGVVIALILLGVLLAKKTTLFQPTPRPSASADALAPDSTAQPDSSAH